MNRSPGGGSSDDTRSPFMRKFCCAPGTTRLEQIRYAPVEDTRHSQDLLGSASIDHGSWRGGILESFHGEHICKFKNQTIVFLMGDVPLIMFTATTQPCRLTLSRKAPFAAWVEVQGSVSREEEKRDSNTRMRSEVAARRFCCRTTPIHWIYANLLY